MEHEEIDFEGTAQEAAQMLKEGQLNPAQIRDLLAKRLKDDKIFGFDNFDDFNRQYFKKELVAFDEFYKIRQLKYSRVKYNNRVGVGKPLYSVDKTGTLGAAEANSNLLVHESSAATQPALTDEKAVYNSDFIHLMNHTESLRSQQVTTN